MVHNPSATAARKPWARAAVWSGLRAGETVALGFFAYAVVATLFFPLTARERLTVLGLNALVAAAVIALGGQMRSRPSRLLGVLRDWLPCVLIVLAYRESGLFLTSDPAHRLDYLFIAWDRSLLGSAWFQSLVAACSPWIQRFMELAYLMVYPFVPLGFAAVYFAGRDAGNPAKAARAKDRFWTTVLLAVLTSYVLFPFFPLTPPRVLFHDLPAATSAGATSAAPVFRQMNVWILKRYSVQACIFPSGHVAGAVATALAVRAYRPRLGILFLFAAVAIAVSTVFGRYHYSADALAGAVVGILADLIATRLKSGKEALTD